MFAYITSFRHKVALAVVVAGSLGCAAMADEVEVVDGKVARAYLLLDPDAHALEKESAADLQWAVRQATGVGLQLLNAPPPASRLIPIRIGTAALAAIQASHAGEWKDLPYDGAVIKAGQDGIDIAGPTPAGTANGVATILLEDIGVRTYYPDDLFTIVPKSKGIRIASRVLRPSFDYRVWSGAVGPEAAAYRRRNRLSDPRVPAPYFGFGHNLGHIIPVEKYGPSHPEYFAFRDGARRPEGTGVGNATQPCFTNAEVVQLTIEATRHFFDENPDRNTFSLCVNDNARYCECETCSALDKPYRDLPVGRQYCESYYDYVSKVADAVAQSHPGKYLGVYAYWNVEQPPRNRKKLPDNVIAALTLDILQHYDPAYREKDRALIEAWAGCVARLHTYVYYGLGWYTPRTSPRLAAEDLAFAASHGVRAIYCEAYPFWAWCGPMHYVAARLQWDVKADVETLLKEFHDDCFGEAASEMRAFHDACERYWTKQRPGRWFEGLDRLGPEAAMADTGILREAQTHLEAASQQAKSFRVRRRIAWISEGFDFTLAVAEAVDAAKVAASAKDRLTRLVAAAHRIETAHKKLAADPAYKHAYYQPGARFDGKCWGWLKPNIQNAAQAYDKELRGTGSKEDADKQWQAFSRESGLDDLLKQRQWKLELEAPAPQK